MYVSHITFKHVGIYGGERSQIAVALLTGFDACINTYIGVHGINIYL